MLPRVYPLVLGELEPKPPAAKTQGKAGNQLGALRCLTALVRDGAVPPSGESRLRVKSA